MVDFAYSPIALLFIVSTVVQSMLLAYIGTSRRTAWVDNTTRTLSYLLVGGIIWSGAYGIHVLLVDPAVKLLWFNLSLLGPSIVVPALLLHVSTYSGRYTDFTRRLRALLWIEPMISTALVLTDSSHDLFRTGLDLATMGATTVIHRSTGPWWYLRTAYLYVLVFLIFIWLFVSYRNAEGLIRRQLRAGVVALSVPLGLNVLFDLQYLFNIVVIQEVADVEFTGVAFGASALVLTYSVYRYRYLDLVPVGRHVAIDRLPDPYVITDYRFQIVDYNTAVAQIVADQDDIMDRIVFDIIPELESLLTDRDVGRQTPVLKQINDAWYEVLVVPLQYSDSKHTNPPGSRPSASGTTEKLSSNADSVQGYSIFLRDVTERISRERVLETWNDQLELLNQIVRHDIRNDANYIVELVRRLQKNAPNSVSGGRDESADPRYLQQIEERGNQIIGLTESLRDLTETFSELGEERKPIPIDEVLEREFVNANMSTEHSPVQMVGELPSVDVYANEMLSSVFRNLFANAIQHTDKRYPEVRVSTSVDDETVTVRIADNGPGLPEERKEAINRSGRPEPSESQSGLGLYIVEMLVTEYEGELTVRDNEPDGTVFFVTLDRVRDDEVD